ncbi:MAG TPA: hypothetical protein DCE41_27180 [Cytophagales bacterium]|nr:hypothetical protein [Cytophagales bacterium]
MIRITLLAAALALITGLRAMATETQVMVREKAKDAKFIGSSLGGAHVLIRSTTNGAILAEGLTQGSTGSTQRIMREPHTRGMTLTDDNTAGFLATLDLQEPTFVRIEVASPYGHRSAQVHASTELWLIPGKHILGDGIILEIPGFIIDILSPRTHRYISLAEVKDQPLSVQANIVMMCGCTINEDGLWDSNDMEVRGILKRNGELAGEIGLDWKSTNLFEAALPLTEPGQYHLTVYAYDPNSGNTGVEQVYFIITGE